MYRNPFFARISPFMSLAMHFHSQVYCIVVKMLEIYSAGHKEDKTEAFPNTKLKLRAAATKYYCSPNKTKNAEVIQVVRECSLVRLDEQMNNSS